ncbi:MAG: methyltransferase domain-containing protein [Thermoplasmata archaeon]
MIVELNQEYDAVISAHNLEHCNDRYGTLEAMLKVIKVGGKLYLSFPSKKL